MTLSTAGFDHYGKTTRRTAFLAEMERVVPWSALCGLIEPVYPKPGNGCPLVGVERCCASTFCLQPPGLAEQTMGRALSHRAQTPRLPASTLQLPRWVPRTPLSFESSSLNPAAMVVDRTSRQAGRPRASTTNARSIGRDRNGLCSGSN
jgi:hypothetical protein